MSFVLYDEYGILPRVPANRGGSTATCKNIRMSLHVQQMNVFQCVMGNIGAGRKIVQCMTDSKIQIMCKIKESFKFILEETTFYDLQSKIWGAKTKELSHIEQRFFSHNMRNVIFIKPLFYLWMCKNWHFNALIKFFFTSICLDWDQVENCSLLLSIWRESFEKLGKLFETLLIVETFKIHTWNKF